MKTAVIAVTEQGAVLAEKIADSLHQSVDIYIKCGRNSTGIGFEYNSLGELLRNKFAVYDSFVFIMAIGIVVRVIAPLIRDKRMDPAVVVIDEQGQNCVSLLSGHIGGANDLTKMIAAIVGANPVITTATDVNKLPAADVLAVKLGLSIEPFSSLKTINAAIVNRDTVCFFIDNGIPHVDRYRHLAQEQDIQLLDLEEINAVKFDFAVIISDKMIKICKPHIFLRPKSLVVGIGCRRGTSSIDILDAIEKSLENIGKSKLSIYSICSTVVKQDEEGLLKAAESLGVPIHFFTNEELQKVIDEYKLEKSVFVQNKIGVGNVCQSAAILGANKGKVLFPKTKYKNLTMSIATVKSM